MKERQIEGKKEIETWTYRNEREKERDRSSDRGRARKREIGGQIEGEKE